MEAFMSKLVRRRNRNGVNDEFLIWGVLSVPNEEEPLGLPAFNGTKSLGFRNPWFEIQMEG